MTREERKTTAQAGGILGFDLRRRGRWLYVLIFFSVFGFVRVIEASEPVANGYRQQVLARFERGLARVQPLLTRYGYGAVTVAVLLEGAGIPAPGQTLLIAGGLEAAGGRMQISWILLLATVAAAIGNSIGYALGRYGGHAVLRRLAVGSERRRRLEDLFKRRGGFVVLLARFVEGLRQLNGIAAGILRMPWWTFTAYNVAGAILWTFVWGLGAYYLERDIHAFAALFQHYHRALYLLASAALISLVIYLLRREKTQRGGEKNA